MRRIGWPGLLLVLVLGCRGDDIAAPELRRPLEDLPAGAQAVVFTSDLRNTWQRIEAHELLAVLEQVAPLRGMLARPEIARWRQAWGEFETRSDLDLENDLVLNVAGGRTAIAVYGVRPMVQLHGAATLQDGQGDLLLVAELAEPERFRSALAAFRQREADLPVEIVDTALDGRPALRLRGENGRELLLLQEGSLLVAATADTLVRGALAIHAGAARTTLLGDPILQEALHALGPHNVVAFERTGFESLPWMAQGITWDPKGLHFEQLRPAPRSAASSAPVHRDEILRSIPDGMTVACYARPEDLGVGEVLSEMRSWTGAQRSDSAAAGSPADWPQRIRALLPEPLRDVAGDEIGIAWLGAEPTAVAPLPDIGLVLELRDPATALQVLRAAEGMLSAVHIHGKGYDFENVSYGGRTFRSLVQPLSESLTPSWLVDGEVAIVTSTRSLMQQIVDTRRSGRRNVLTDASFRRFRSFVPHDAILVTYGDPRRLHRTLAQVAPSAGRWGESVQRAVQELERLAALGEHFPAGALYVVREAERVSTHGWLVEAD